MAANIRGGGGHFENNRVDKKKRTEECNNKKIKKVSTAPGVPRRSPIQVLTGLDVA